MEVAAAPSVFRTSGSTASVSANKSSVSDRHVEGLLWKVLRSALAEKAPEFGISCEAKLDNLVLHLQKRLLNSKGDFRIVAAGVDDNAHSTKVLAVDEQCRLDSKDESHSVATNSDNNSSAKATGIFVSVFNMGGTALLNGFEVDRHDQLKKVSEAARLAANRLDCTVCLLFKDMELKDDSRIEDIGLFDGAELTMVIVDEEVRTLKAESLRLQREIAQLELRIEQVYGAAAAVPPVVDPMSALKTELMVLKPGALSKRARAEGVTPDAMDEAADDDDPRAALIQIIIAKVAARGCGAADVVRDFADPRLSVYFQQAGLVQKKLLFQRKELFGVEDEIDQCEGAGDMRTEARASVITLFEQLMGLKMEVLKKDVNAGLLSIVEARSALLTMVKADNAQIVASDEHMKELKARLDKLKTSAHAEDADDPDDNADRVNDIIGCS